MSQWNYSGAKWWKFDFHTHTPASTDFMQGCTDKEKAVVTSEYWLQKFMQKGIDCVAVTDHNSGEWIDTLKNTLENLALEENKPDWYRPIHLFPGVEISVNGGVHLLAIFTQSKNQDDIDSLLGAVGYNGTKGHSDEVTTKTMTEVVDIIVERGGIAIPAHVDKEKGLFKIDSNSLKQALDNPHIHAMELCDSESEKPQLYSDKKLQWAEVSGSDTHSFKSKKFGDFTWIKMDSPSIEGLKLALMDGKVSVNRNMLARPNRHAEYIIEELAVSNAKYMGQPEALNCQFSPFLNTLIGGRGTGKSTLLEFMRFTLRRNKELPASLQQESDKYFQVGGENLLTEDSELSLVYRKGESRYRLNWSAQADTPSLEVDNNGWEAEEGEIASLFPVYIYSQKQIFELAKEPQALIDIIDKDASVGYENLKQQQIESINRFKAIEKKIVDLTEKVDQKNKLQGSANDLVRQIKQIEQSGHKNVLQNYRKRQQQLTTIKNIEDDWQQMVDHLIETQRTMFSVKFDASNFDGQNDILSAINRPNKQWDEINKKLSILTQEAKSAVANWMEEKQAASWMQKIKTEMSRYQQLQTQLEQQGINPEKYPALLQQQAVINKQLNNIKNYSTQIETLTAEKLELFTKIESNRKLLTKNRQRFLSKVLAENQSVHIRVKPFGENWAGIEQHIRKTLQCQDKFVKDMEHLKDIYGAGGEEKIKEIKKSIINIRNREGDVKDGRFATHIQQLPQESISNLLLWFPKDALEIKFGNQKKIKQGSPGQKTAALLAFILSYGEEPLLLDQPEDDLDNELIYSLIVKQLREIKSKRQVIIVTHNANIVVNGDAEMVLPLTVASGQTHIEQAASIQSQNIRNKICDILEGGQQAFTQRYKRIHLETNHV